MQQRHACRGRAVLRHGHVDLHTNLLLRPPRLLAADWVTGEVTDVNGGYFID